MFNPDYNDYQLTSIISECSGGLAVVYSALYKPSKQYVAVKRYFVDKSKENANLIQQDILTRKELQHHNILPYLSSFVHGRELYIVSPLMTLGSCRDVLDRYFHEGLPELACAIILRDVLCALQYLHKQLYIHRSVRASHVLLSGAGGARLSGLRSAASLAVRGRRARALHALPPRAPGDRNLAWLSPELLEQNLKGYDERSDIYSLGVLSCELGNGAAPFSALPATLVLTEKLRGSRPRLLDCSTLQPAPADDAKSQYPAILYTPPPATLVLTEKLRGSRPRLLDCSTLQPAPADDAKSQYPAILYTPPPATLVLTEKLRGSRPRLLDCSTLQPAPADDAKSQYPAILYTPPPATLVLTEKLRGSRPRLLDCSTLQPAPADDAKSQYPAILYTPPPATLVLTEKLRGSRPRLLDCSTLQPAPADDAKSQYPAILYTPPPATLVLTEKLRGSRPRLLDCSTLQPAPADDAKSQYPAILYTPPPATLVLTEKLRGSRPRLLDCSTLQPAPADDAKSQYPAILYTPPPATLVLTEKLRGSRPRLLDCSTLQPAPADDAKSLYNTDSGVGDGAEAEGAALRQLYCARRLSDAFHHFTDSALAKDPEARPSATQMLGHPFFRQIRKTDFLPSLIGRVPPIKPDPDDMSALLLQEKLSEMEIEKSTEWDF